MSLKADDHIEAMSIKDKELDTLKSGLATALELHSKFETYSKSSKEIIDRLAEISPTITHHLSSLLPSSQSNEIFYLKKGAAFMSDHRRAYPRLNLD